MSEEFARLLCEKLTKKIDSLELQGTDIRISLIMYRNSILETMADMGYII